MSTNIRALVVDDDPDIRELLCHYLARYGMTAEGAGDGDAMRSRLQASEVDIVILDLMLPGEDGLSLCRWLRSHSTIPVIMLTARGEPMDRIVGLEIGADDYMAKPFEPRELVARIQSVLRRTHMRQPQDSTAASTGTEPHFAEETVCFEQWKLNRVLHQLIAPDGVIITLSNAEFRLLGTFLAHPFRILSRDQLLDEARGRSIEAFDRSIDLLVSRLRQKLQEDPREPRLIKTVRGQGYLFNARVLPCSA
jgi:two-component system OmpR family response regulator